MADIFTRSQHNPILRPGREWWKIYNPGAALDENGVVHLYPRVMKREEDWHSRIGHATSRDGEHFAWDEAVTLERQDPDELRGLEDPRVAKIGDTYHMAFAAYDGKTVKLHTATTGDLNGPWHRNGPSVPNFDFFASGGRIVRWEHGKPVEKIESRRGSHWSKSGAFFPEKIGGKYALVFGEFYMWFATSEDGKSFEVEKEQLLGPRKGTKLFDNTFIETGPPPILTERGLLLLYHGIDEAFRYRLGFALLDRDDPRKVLYHHPEPIFGPREEYELGEGLIDVLPGGVAAMAMMSDEELKEHYKQARDNNVFPQVTFVCGTVLREGNLWLYYGAGDTSLCTAWAPLADILKLIS